MSAPVSPKVKRAKEALTGALSKEMPVEEALAKAAQGTGVSFVDAARALASLVEEKRAAVFDPSPPASTFDYLAGGYAMWFWGEMLYLLITVSSIYLFPQYPPFIYVRYVFGATAILYFPGYNLIEALYPKKEDLDSLERLALSIGLSLALVPLVGLLLNYTPWGIRLDPIIISLVLLGVGLAFVAAYRKESYISLAAKAR